MVMKTETEIQQEILLTSFVQIINKTLNQGPFQRSPFHGRYSQTTAYPPSVLSLFVWGESIY